MIVYFYFYTNNQEQKNANPIEFLRDKICDLINWIKGIILPNIKNINNEKEGSDSNSKKRKNASKTDELKVDLANNVLQV